MNNDRSDFLDEIKRAVGEKKYDRAIKAIKDSICPQYTAFMILTRGLQEKKKGVVVSRICHNHIQSNNLIQICTSWANQSNFFPKPPAGVASEINDIYQFLNIRGNPYSFYDLFKICQREKSFFNPDSILHYLWRTGWHRGINIQKIFAEISNPDSNGELTEINNESYRLLNYAIGYPHHSGQSEKETDLFNSDWICYGLKDEEEVDNPNSIIRQVTDKMENIEDNKNQLDVEIIRNRNIHRLLLFGGPKSIQSSQVAAEELNTIYGNKGDFILSMLEDDDVATALYPVLLKRLRDRAADLYIRKINEPKKWSMQLDHDIPNQRTIYKRERLTVWLRDEYSYLEAKEIQYPPEKVFLLEKFVKILDSIESIEWPSSYSDSIELKRILTNLKSTTNLDIKLSYYRALCLYSGALFLHELCSADIIDPVTSSSVKTAIEIGISEIENHGYFNILTLLAESLKKPRVKKDKFYPIEIAVHEISGLLFTIDFEKANQIAAAGALFFKTLSDIEKDIEGAFINCKIDKGNLSLLLDSGAPIEFDLTSYNVYKTTK